MSSAARWLRRGLRTGARRVWADARPSTPTDLRRRHAGLAPRDGSPPTPEQRFVPDTVATGPWADRDPLYAPAWPSRVASLTAVAFWAVVGFRVRRELRSDEDAGPATDAREDRPDPAVGS